MQYEIKKINWIDVIFSNIPTSNSVTVLILSKAWSIYEKRETNWISHFLEHMFFKGWKKYPTPQIVAETIDEIWWEFNAYTGEEYAGYYVKAAPQYIFRGIDVLGDMLVNSLFPVDEMEREKSVVIQEIMMYEDMPHRLVIDKFKRYFYGDNSYGRPITWPAENIKTFTQDDLFQHKNSLYTKDNTIIIIAWKIENQADIEDKVSETFKELPEKRIYEMPKFDKFKPENRIEFTDKKTEQNHLVIWVDWYDIFDEKRFAADILSIILWWNMSSRLFQEIREKRGLCYYISGNHYNGEINWLFMIRAGIEKDRFDFGTQAIYDELQKIAEGDIKKEEFEKALWYLKWSTQIWIETSDQMAEFIWRQYLIKKEIESLEDILRDYEKVKYEEIVEMANILSKDKLYMYYIK
mgnify:CR=1 FL=1